MILVSLRGLQPLTVILEESCSNAVELQALIEGATIFILTYYGVKRKNAVWLLLIDYTILYSFLSFGFSCHASSF